MAGQKVAERRRARLEERSRQRRPVREIHNPTLSRPPTMPNSRDVLDRDTGRRQVTPNRRIAAARTREICAEGVQHLKLVANITQSLVAVEAQQSPDLARGVIVVDVFGIGPATNGALPALRGEHRVDVGLTDAIPGAEVVFPASAVQTFASSTRPRVVTRLAVAAATPSATLALGKVFERLDGLAVGTPALT